MVNNGYTEVSPGPALAPLVECFWTRGPSSQAQRVLPDACLDIVFSRTTGLRIVGTMTRPLLVAASGDDFAGVRFRPGMARPFVGPSTMELSDRVLPLAEIWGKRGRALEEKLRNTSVPAALLASIEVELKPPCHVSPVQRALAYLARHAGAISLCEISRDAGLSERQFRRRCLEETGITPKQFARIARFRRACSSLGPNTPAPALALDCGYYDQSHFIHDFEEFSGQTPGEYLRRHIA